MALQYQRLIVYQRAVQYDQIVTTNVTYVRKRDPNLADHITAQRSLCERWC